MNSKEIGTKWYPENKLVVTQVSGDLDEFEIEQWERGLNEIFEELRDGESFKILIDMHGFQAADTAAHKRFRNIIPQKMAEFGWKVGYVNLFEEEADRMILANYRNIQCIGAAHCHHDAGKMELYERRFSRYNEHFFTDREEARKWIEQSC
ncbi:hypothetical protein [Dyadobacter crusticola]|uniref:hypothetical protein n=1 Tax=Dyadobacter crusticola TaxID=292407 RepID=UPI0004E21B6D|nr:hypothetical protein [Dyadobacter crusticola]